MAKKGNKYEFIESVLEEKLKISTVKINVAQRLTTSCLPERSSVKKTATSQQAIPRAAQTLASAGRNNHLTQCDFLSTEETLKNHGNLAHIIQKRHLYPHLADLLILHVT